MPPTHIAIEHALHAQANPEKAQFFQRFFKTGPGQYGHGERFLGLSVPQVRSVVALYRTASLGDCLALLASPYNEVRLCALLLMVAHYQRRQASATERQALFDAYVAQRAQVNNWNLVDASAPALVGSHLLERPRTVLAQWARSSSLWDRRIAVVSTFTFIRAGQFDDTLALCEQLLSDREDLMHKACGWMLREVGKRDQAVLCTFLDSHAQHMPRTMLRYALERLGAEQRLAYMAHK